MASEQLNRKRGQIKAQMTRFESFLISEASDNITEINVRLKKFETLLSKFEDTQQAIEDLSGERYPEQMVDHNIQRESFENDFYKLQVQAIEKIEQLSGNRMQPAQSDESVHSQVAGDRNTNIKLPRITLPKFSGEFDRWLQFKDAFISVIHENDALPAVQKLQYLRSSLQGEALENICALKTTAENYDIAWELLLDRYEKPRRIVNSHVRKLLDHPSVAKDDPVGLRHFINHISTNVRELQSLGLPVNQWDAILIPLKLEKLDSKTQEEWDKHISEMQGEELPTMDELQKFLKRLCDRLEATKKTVSKTEDSKQTISKRPFTKRLSLAATVHNCEYCSGTHFIYRCEAFLRLSIPERMAAIKGKLLCINCLGGGHFAKECKASTCRKCGKNHNTLLHSTLVNPKVVDSFSNLNISQDSVNKKEPQEQAKHLKDDKGISKIEKEEYSMSMYCNIKSSSQVILSTAQVIAYGVDGKQRICRALLDPGSQSNLVTADLIKRLGLTAKPTNIPLSGVNLCQANVKQSARIKLRAMQGMFEAALDCLVLPKITGRLPQVRINPNMINIPEGIHLADPLYNEPGEVDMLIGAGVFWELLSVGQIKVAKGMPILQKTKLGWIIGGELTQSTSTSIAPSCHLVTNGTLNKQLERFWTQENLVEHSDEPIYSKWDEACEEHFVNTFKRESDGRFIVELPKIKDIVLGDSEKNALKRLVSLEKRMEKDSMLKNEYTQFIEEYQRLGHMTLVREPRKECGETYYIPHQAVIRPESLTTKLRVVFDASMKTSTGNSLNDKLLAGAKLQGDLLNIMLRFRTHRYVITADVEKMFRQIKVSESDRDLQRILWRNKPSDPVQIFNLTTVTYGTKSAPFLAMRCLKQLAKDDGKNYSSAAQALQEDSYVDEMLSGTDNLESTILLREQLTQLLNRGQFNLRKWRSNDPQILSTVAKDNKSLELLIIDSKEAIKTLGLLWDSSQDNLQYNVTITEDKKITKRSILSKVAQIYDPLGLIGPVLIVAKMFIQQLWQEKLDWDESLPQSLHTAWKEYYSSLPKLNELRIGRNVNFANSSNQFNIFGFSDASEKAYGACIYAVYVDFKGCTKAHLICSKSRVAPLRTLSLPRLELLGAVLLSELLVTVKTSFNAKLSNAYLWSDSTIVLQWIKTSPHQLKTFVANRVARIQTLVPGVPWYHVPSAGNPADLLSRGMTTADMTTDTKWWLGPQWMVKGEWPDQPEVLKEHVPEQKEKITLIVTREPLEVLNKYSSYHKLCRVIAFCNRFIENSKGSRIKGSLTSTELNKAEKCVTYEVQQQIFHQEIKDLKSRQAVDKKSRLASLNPYLDNDGLIRVGGRLRRADIDNDQKHQILLPSKHIITTLMLQQEHKRLMHCGPEQLLYSMRHKYWPLSGRREAQKVTRSCITCFRMNPQFTNVKMGDLPKDRVTGYNKPFTTTGVDYAGPLQVREGKRRGRIPISKAYIAVFTCFSTKAVHLELVSDLTASAFLATLRRFCARRGICSNLYSDNGTNFVGANNELNNIYAFLQKEETNIKTALASRKINWHFIPPKAPHMGGLWEAAVKAAKRHLNAVTRGLILTFEEVYTLLTEIEAILNSRPLTPLSSDPNDFLVLSPSHFLFGDSQLQPVEHNYLDVSDNRLSRWQHIQKVRQHFWKRWHQEYLSQLQTRTKWTHGGDNLIKDVVVLIKEDNTPPLHWPLGRILEVHPGTDGIVRVATVRTPAGIVKRHVNRLCLLPLQGQTNNLSI